MNQHHWGALTGIGCVVFAWVTLGIWIPAGVESGVIEEVRRQTVVGDALAPTLWVIGIGLLGVLLAVSSWMRLKEGVNEPPSGGPTATNWRYLALVLGLMTLSLVVMTTAGPALVKLAQALGSDWESYRSLRGTRPWKYTGYFCGGFLLVFGLMSFIEGRLTGRLALIVLLAVVAMGLLYDLPFKNLLLPPNGDQ